MTTLTKQMRDHAVGKILQATFEARQNDLIDRIEAAITKLAKQEWPIFYKLREVPENREFVNASQNNSLQFINGYRINFEFVVRGLWTAFAVDGQLGERKAHLLSVPIYKTPPALPANNPLVDEYKEFISAMQDARRDLLNAFYAYRSREKLEAELPDLARYLPPRVVTNTAIVVKPADIMAGLAKHGIPPTRKASNI